MKFLYIFLKCLLIKSRSAGLKLVYKWVNTFLEASRTLTYFRGSIQININLTHHQKLIDYIQYILYCKLIWILLIIDDDDELEILMDYYCLFFVRLY